MINQIEFYEAKLAYEMDPSDLFEILQSDPNIVVIDTRKSFAFEKEHIPSAVNFPHREMSAETTKQLNPNMVYVCYCDGIGCNASTKGALNLSKLGFRVKELIGGLEWWIKDGYATEGTVPSGGGTFECAC